MNCMLSLHIILLCVLHYCLCYEVRIDCHPDKNASEERCIERGCLWLPQPVAGSPWCIFNATSPIHMAGYNVVKFQKCAENVLIVWLKRAPTPTIYGNDHSHLIARFSAVLQKNNKKRMNSHVLRLEIVPGLDSNRYLNKVRCAHGPWQITFAPKTAKYRVDIQMCPFGFSIKSGKKQALIFDTVNLPGFTIAQHFLQISTRVPTRNVYGMGEQFHLELRRDFNWKRYSLFNQDQPPIENTNLYGFHPFYLGLDAYNKPYGVFSNNSYPMDYFLQPDPDLLTFRLMGGNMDLFFLAGFEGGADEVIAEYTRIVGRPLLPPLWGLGFQLSRFGYRNLSMLRDVYERNRAAGIPQDVQYLDIDYMNARMDFTYDAARFKELTHFVRNELQENGRKLVPIFDPGIAINSSYHPYSDGLINRIFITDATNGQPLQAKVWPGVTVFPDFTSNHNVSNWWVRCLSAFHSKLPYDGVWLDMNEPSSFVDGSMTGCQKNALNYPPFSPVAYEPIYRKTICMDAKHANGTHLQFHNIYGHSEAVVTNRALRRIFPQKRPYVLSRSTAPGTGKYAAHWMGDTFSTWKSLNQSIIALLEFNMFGIPWSGSDICGFNGNTDEEMCLRWTQLGAFYPFCRNHNSDDSRDQDPGAWSEETRNAMRQVLLQRYSLLPYLYSLMYRAHKYGHPVARPMFFDFAPDPLTHNMHDQFLWGRSLLIAPLLEPHIHRRSVYFPKGHWFNLNSELTEVENWEKNRWITEILPRNSTGLFIKGGAIIPWQEPGLSVSNQMNNSFGLTVALNGNDTLSRGELFWDDGVSTELSDYYWIQFWASANETRGSLQMKPQLLASTSLPSLDTVRVAGLSPFSGVSGVRLNGLQHNAFLFNATARTLFISKLAINLNIANTLSWNLY